MRLVGISPTLDVEIVDADLATVSAEADKLFLIKGPEPWLLNLELQASYKADLPDRLHFASTLATRRHGLAVQSMAILLRPEADGSAMTGRLQRTHPPNCEYLGFHYDMLRLWQLPVESILSGGLGIMPLAPLAAGAESQLEHVVEQMYTQVSSVADSTEQGSLWAEAFVLMGLRYSRETASILFRGVHTMEESVTYQAIIEKGFTLGIAKERDEGLAKGHVEAARDMLLNLGTRRFGAPPPAILKAVDEISDYEQLKRLAQRLDEIKGWDKLLVS